MIDLRFSPITLWPADAVRTDAYARETMPGKRTYEGVLSGLETEMNALRAKDIIIESFHKDKDIRQDGYLRANAAQPSAPGIILYFYAEKTIKVGGKWVPIGPLRYACDRYHEHRIAGRIVRQGWLDNLRAIVMTLEALRGIDRWGVASSGEQYRGWAALPAPPPVSPKEDAARLLLKAGGYELTAANVAQILSSPSDARKVWGQASRMTQGGNASDFMAVQAAWQVLGKGQG